MVACLVLPFISYSVSSSAQQTSTDLSTGNLIVIDNWSGVRYSNNFEVSLCCTGGPQPALNVDTNTLRFSWGYSTAAQSIAINKVFESIGTGIKVTGYNYSWKINNADYTSGPLYGNVSLIGINGNILESYNYNYSRYIPDFETFSGTQKFSKDYGVPSLLSIDVSFTGSDNRFWAGYYGPRVRDVNLSLNYAFDTSKPPASITAPTTVVEVNTLENSPESTGLNSSTVGLPQEVLSGLAPDVLANPTTNTQNNIQQSNNSSATNPNAPLSVESNRDSANKNSSAGPSTLALSVVQKNREAVKAIENQAVQKAQDQIANEAKLSQQQVQLAIDTVQQTQQSGQGLQLSLVSNNTFGMSLNRQSVQYQSTQFLQQASTSSVQGNVYQQEVKLEQRYQEVPQIPQQISSSKTDPVKAITEPSFSLDSVPQETKLEAMRKDAKDNDVAGGVSIASIATVPNGYADYTNLQLLDAKFYSVKPIYQNQRVVDNVRILRGLGSDQKHQQMVQDQYK